MNSSGFRGALPTDLLEVQKYAYELISLRCIDIVPSVESKDYGACTFTLGYKNIIFRVAKKTPTKVGQFVTFWKRIGSGPIMPYDCADSFDFFVVSVRSGKNFGQFVFPKHILWEKGVISKERKGGKRAIRVYPPWDTTDNAQAIKTQAWQQNYFFEILPTLDIITMQRLFS